MATIRDVHVQLKITNRLLAALLQRQMGIADAAAALKKAGLEVDEICDVIQFGRPSWADEEIARVSAKLRRSRSRARPRPAAGSVTVRT